MTSAVDFEIPVRTVNELNGSHQHWSVVARRRKHVRQAAMVVTIPHARRIPLPVVVTLRRLSAGVLDDDGLRAALKSARDGIADALGLRDDSDPRVTWRYEQGKCARGRFGVRVRIEAAPAVAAKEGAA